MTKISSPRSMYVNLYVIITYNFVTYVYVIIADNGLSFIETSALDSSNVELAFQRILTGK